MGHRGMALSIPSAMPEFVGTCGVEVLNFPWIPDPWDGVGIFTYVEFYEFTIKNQLNE